MFDEFLKKEQTPEQVAELEKWHEGVKQKAAAALEVREERFKQAEREFEEQVNRGRVPSQASGDGIDVERTLSENDGVVGTIKALKIDKADPEEKSSRTIEILSDHFSPDAVKQDFLPRDTIPPPRMPQIVREIHPEIRPAAPVVPVVPVITDASLAALTAAVNGLTRRLDTIEQNQTEVANRTLNAVCNSLNETLKLVRKELSEASPRLVESVSRAFEPALKPVLEALEDLKKKPEPEPDPKTQEPAKEPEPAPEPANEISLGEICLDAYRSIIPASWPASPDDSSIMELAYELILKQTDYDNKLATERFMKLLHGFNKVCVESGATRHPKTFYEYVKTI